MCLTLEMNFCMQIMTSRLCPLACVAVPGAAAYSNAGVGIDVKLLDLWVSSGHSSAGIFACLVQFTRTRMFEP
jgi:hypothetical protein